MDNYMGKVKELLLATLPYATPASGGNFIVTKCVFCGDGKNITSRHLYISVNPNDQLPWCYCHLCHTSANLTSDTLSNYFGVYDVEFLVNNTKYFNKIYKSAKYKNNLSTLENYKITNINRVNELSDAKIRYINKRLGTNLNYQDMDRLKICLNLETLLEDNRIDRLTRDVYIVNELNVSFLGFISTDNAFVNLRNLRQNKLKPPLNKRYINYNIFDRRDNTQRFYIIPTDIDLNKPQPIKIHIAEGSFDILSVCLNLRHTAEHNIYAAVNGSGFINIIKHFINRLKLINVEFHIYKDNDMEDYIIEDIANRIRPYFIPLYLHNNSYEGEKDFGVPVHRIHENITQLI